MLDELPIPVMGFCAIQGHEGILNLLLVAPVDQERAWVQNRCVGVELFEVRSEGLWAHSDEVDITPIRAFQTVNDFDGFGIVLWAARDDCERP